MGGSWGASRGGQRRGALSCYGRGSRAEQSSAALFAAQCCSRKRQTVHASRAAPLSSPELVFACALNTWQSLSPIVRTTRRVHDISLRCAFERESVAPFAITVRKGAARRVRRWRLQPTVLFASVLVGRLVLLSLHTDMRDVDRHPGGGVQPFERSLRHGHERGVCAVWSIVVCGTRDRTEARLSGAR